MAEEKEETQEEKKGSKKLLIIIIVAVVMLIVVAIATIAMILLNDDEKDATQNIQTIEQPQPVATTQRQRVPQASSYEDNRKLSQIGILFPLDTFTVNLKSDSGKRYLKTTISLELEGKELAMELNDKNPVIRDRIIRILSSKTVEEISSSKGKLKVSEQIMDTLNMMIVDGRVNGVYFTDFVVQ
ncbi:MAG: flagellar basal body-associated protein FliL [Sulfurimonadaceae bacterium]|jgi:flagellar FliL protein|nr:flagellar basal body-associated protein FliL [Sulfurimonadaceae bacterium]